MRALSFLWSRSIINGLRRSLTSGRRLIGLLFFASYYVWMLRPMWSQPSSRPGKELESALLGLQLPPLNVIEVLVFAAYLLLSCLLGLSVLSYKGGFRPADVDVLFPTPVSPKVVMMFRLGRDTVLTLILPLIFALLFGRQFTGPALQVLQKLPNPEMAPYLSRLTVVAWLLTSLAWVSIGYAASIYFNRADGATDRAKRVAIVGMVTFAVGLIAGLSFLMYRQSTAAEWLDFGAHPAVRSVFFLATGATWLTLGPLAGNWPQAFGGFLILVGTIAAGMTLALRQSGFFYEEAALNAAQTEVIRKRSRQANVFQAAAKEAQDGKLKIGKPKWLDRWRPTGMRALVWKEAVLLWRAYKVLILIFVPLGGVWMIPVALIGPGKPAWILAIFMQVMATMLGTLILANTGYQELLARVDLQKPFPFTPGRTLFAEIWGKSLLGIASAWAGAIVMAITRPDLWSVALACFFLMPTLAALLSAVFAVLALLLPDQDDATQRGFRSLMQLLGIMMFVGPSGLLFVGLISLAKLSAPIAAIPVILLNLIMAGVAAAIAGQLYISYNPNE